MGLLDGLPTRYVVIAVIVVLVMIVVLRMTRIEDGDERESTKTRGRGRGRNRQRTGRKSGGTSTSTAKAGSKRSEKEAKKKAAELEEDIAADAQELYDLVHQDLAKGMQQDAFIDKVGDLAGTMEFIELRQLYNECSDSGANPALKITVADYEDVLRRGAN